ncbi:hypothetical protein NHP190012_02620 [Helicobacter sp. NHP19-012]|uniref:TonB C-terminal domain-containing protein n=1 Tax=Helicobacter gastrofelis TaxID=2849642 RepID=A0ABM7SKH1_9HELI|nr:MULTISPECIES: TonB C-terminal domain-containing protein [unclassified Helicobacter]BCZ18620.1 hypothetical protein NHP190012_02620 [Helicobacter sp. NHP19-012]GMB95889.1 hypothetical protein NHP22001_04780 [Helicobacter sp. NHP22-001]
MRAFLFVGCGLLALLCYGLLLSLLLLKPTESVPPLVLPPIQVDLIDSPPPSPSPTQADSGLGVKDMFSAIPDKQAAETNSQEAKDLQRAQDLLRNIQFGKPGTSVFKDLQESLAKLEDIKTLQAKKMEVQVPKEEESTLKEDKAWFTAIYKILYSQWKLSFDQKTSVGALITIYPSGQMHFSLVDFSPFREYNQQIENLLAHLQQQRFPPYPQGRAITLKVNFKTKDK